MYCSVDILVSQARSITHVTYLSYVYDIVNITLAALVWQSYSHVVPIVPEPCANTAACRRAFAATHCSLMKVIVWAVAILGYIAIVTTRFHYSIDVFLGICLTLFTWKLFHR